MRMKPYYVPENVQVVKAIWIPSGKSKMPKNGTWHQWINEVFVFIKDCLIQSR